ncbi:hypothetical protein [Lysinibacillus sphaericus]|uniref:hypothetical protein n=1 Tax=Lysinibacillus sphaericus TaxID=1421 RepID=UPI003D7FD7C0
MKFKKVALMVCCLGLLVSMFSFDLTNVHAVQMDSNSDKSGTMDPYLEEYLNDFVFNEDTDFYKILAAIELLPSDIEELSADEMAEWLFLESNVEVYAEGDSLVFPTFKNKEIPIKLSSRKSRTTFASWTDYAGCIGAVGLAALQNALPITKVLKIRSTLQALGGATRAIRAIHTNYKYYRSQKYSVQTSLNKAITDIVDRRKLGADTRQLLTELFSVGIVINSCKKLFSYEFDEKRLDRNKVAVNT